MAQVASQQKMCGDFLSSLLHRSQKFVRSGAGYRVGKKIATGPASRI